MNAAFHSSEYETYCLLGDPDATPIWEWPKWSTIGAHLESLVESARGTAAVRSNQYTPEGEVVRFGRTALNTSGHQKWAHGSPTNRRESKYWKFLSTEVWAPSWTACERENRAPDVYFCITNEALSGGFNRRLAFNPVLILATSVDLAPQGSSEVRACVAALQRASKAKLCAYKRRVWGVSSGSGFTDSIQDLAASRLFSAEDRHAIEPTISTLAGDWAQCEPGRTS